MATLTKRQNEIFSYIKKYIKANGYPPSIPDMAEALNMNHSTTQTHLHCLERAGVITRKPKTPRSIAVVKGVKVKVQ